MAFPWPSVLVPQRCDVNLRNFAASGGRTPTTRQQRVFSDAGFWEIRALGIVIDDREKVYAYRALLARLRQGESVIMPTFDCHWPVGSQAAASGAALLGAASLRDTNITVAVSGMDIKAGHYFSIGNHLHQVTEVTSVPIGPAWENQIANDSPWSDEQPWVDAVDITRNYGIDFLPPLRSNYPDAQTVRFDATKTLAVLPDMNDGDLEIEAGRVAYPSLTLIESLS